MPEVPPVADTLPGFEINTWWGLVVPTATPADTARKLNTALTEALRSPEARERFSALVAEPAHSTPEQFEAFMACERSKYKRVVKISVAKID